jgi:predicted PurR-regulated permease PerM
MLLSPGVHLLHALKIPQSLAAAVVLIGTIILLAGAAYALSAPAQEWIQRIPTTFYKIEQKLSVLKEPFEKLREATEKFQQATELDHTPRTQQVEIRSPSLTDILLNGTPQVLAAIGLVIILLFFLLASGDVFLRKLVSVIPSFHDKKRAVEIVRSIQQDISYYLLTITLVNICLGICVTLAMAFLDIPNPMLWGAVVGILNFAPYAGAVTSLLIMTMIGMLTFDSLSQALLVPGVVAVMLFTTSQVIVPLVLGRRLLLSPVAIFVAIIVWGWLWGIIGALLAVPLLASFKIVCERVEPLQPIAEFLTP